MVIIEDWPNTMLFKNLRKISSTFIDLENLFNMWQTGQMYWKMITEDELHQQTLKTLQALLVAM